MAALHDQRVRQPRTWTIEEWIVEILKREGMQSLDGLTSRSPEDTAPMLLAIDRLSRNGVISLWRLNREDYLLALNRKRDERSS